MKSYDNPKTIGLLVPVYNEEQSVPFFMEKIRPIIAACSHKIQVIFINDGSKDKTLEILRDLKAQHDNVSYISFSRNFGKEAALTAGFDFANNDAVIPIDCDLQDPPEVILDMIKCWEEGYKVVYAVRNEREADSYCKRITANLFYKFFNKMAEAKIPPHAGDFRLFDNKVVLEIRKMRERSRFMKGITTWVGFNSKIIYYKRAERALGETKWNYWRLWKFAVDGITSFSSAPLTLWSYVGSLVALSSLAYGIFLIIRTLFFGADVPGYASIMVAILFTSGIQLISMGIIGEYLSRIFKEVKQRPIYIVEESNGL